MVFNLFKNARNFLICVFFRLQMNAFSQKRFQSKNERLLFPEYCRRLSRKRFLLRIFLRIPSFFPEVAFMWGTWLIDFFQGDFVLGNFLLQVEIWDRCLPWTFPKYYREYFLQTIFERLFLDKPISDFCYHRYVQRLFSIDRHRTKHTKILHCCRGYKLEGNNCISGEATNL